jgi:hypothetical protein
MRQIKECDCSPGTISLRSVKINIIGSRIELEYTKCNGIVDWWEEPVHNRKITPFKRKWS